jgi:hypothetical protein
MEGTMNRVALRRATILTVLVVLAAAWPAGCDDGNGHGTPDAAADVDLDVGIDADADAGGDAETSGDGALDVEAEADVPPVVCTVNNGISADVELAGSGPTLIEYRAYMGSEVPYEVLRVQISGDNVGTVGPGVYDLAGTTFSDCQVCVSILTGCYSGPCARFFYPVEGTIEITAIGGEGERFAGHLRGIRMAEFEILPDGIATEPLPGGDDWCIADHAFDMTAASNHDAICGRPTVPCLGETVLDFSLQNCSTGEMVAMSTLAAGKKALVYSMVTGWCPYCADWMTTLVGYQTTYADAGLEVAYVYGENTSGGPQPSLADCLGYAARHGADPNSFYVDHDGTYAFTTTTYAMWPWLVTSDTMSLPWSTIIDPATFEYVYTSQAAPPPDFETVMLGLLGL